MGEEKHDKKLVHRGMEQKRRRRIERRWKHGKVRDRKRCSNEMGNGEPSTNI
jgi:hypothetical protein